MIAPAAMPISLICVGAGLDFRTLREAVPKLAVASALKLIAAPALLWTGVTLAGGGPLAASVAAGIGGAPAAAAGFTMAREMGGDPKLVAAIITATTALSFITLPIVLTLVAPR